MEAGANLNLPNNVSSLTCTYIYYWNTFISILINNIYIQYIHNYYNNINIYIFISSLPLDVANYERMLRSNGYFFEKCQNDSYVNLNMCMIIIIQLQSFWSSAIKICNSKIINISALDVLKYFGMNRQTFCLFEQYIFYFFIFF